MKELKSRCRGYLGQFYELIKPINATYDIAVKVAMQKCLKLLVVDSEEAATICNEFLKEKNISKDLLVLSNVPDRPFAKGLQAKLHDTSAQLIYDVIECSRQNNHLERAVRYFSGSKVCVKDF